MNLAQEVFNYLAIKDQWYGLGQIINDVGDKIPSERATHIFARRNCRNGHNKNVPLDDQIRRGRRSAILSTLIDLQRSKRIEVRGEDFQREYRRIEECYPIPDVRTADREESPDEDTPTKKDLPEEITELIDLAESYLYELCPPDHADNIDVAFHCRGLRRIVRNLKRSNNG